LTCGGSAPAHAFLGLLGKAVSKAATAGKAAGTAGKAAGTVGKGAAVGAAAEGATTGMAAKGAAAVSDDAAHAGLRGGSHLEPSAVNAALPPEVASYLAKPAKDLTPADTARMMDSYSQMVERAGKTGDFSIVEQMPNSAKTPPLKKPAEIPSPAPRDGGAPARPASLPIHGLQLVAHAALAGNRKARAELNRLCTEGSAESKRFSDDTRAQPEFKQHCASHKATGGTNPGRNT
jgi:hypothetical protein